MENKNIRNSNHELMRIISMFFIVLGHVILKGKVHTTANPNLRVFYLLTVFILIIHVNSYVLLTGYYQSKSTFKQSKLWAILNASLFYRIIIVVIFLSLNIVKITKVQLLKDISYFPRDYWYITCYVLLYCISPFLNKLINVLNKKEHKNLIITSFIIFSILPTISAGEIVNNDGYTLYNFIFLYFIGAYLRKYPIEQSYIFKKYSKTIYKCILVTIFFSCVIINFLFYNYASQIREYNSFFQYISDIINAGSLSYSNPIIVIQSIAYFLLFTTFDIKSRFINWYSKLMLGIYMIHEQHYIRGELYKWLHIVDGPNDKYIFIINVFGSTLIIFIICSVLEWARQKLFKWIYNRKISKKIRDKYYFLLSNI